MTDIARVRQIGLPAMTDDEYAEYLKQKAGQKTKVGLTPKTVVNKVEPKTQEVSE